SSGNSQSDGFRLSFETASIYIDFKINGFGHLDYVEWFFDLILDMFLWKVHFKGFPIDFEVPVSFFHKYSGYRCFPSSDRVYYFHGLKFKFFGLLGLMWM